jgi:opacity protein-like surface antigen
MLRKTLYGTLAVSLLLVSATTADAQFASPIRFNVHAGAALPVGDFASNDIDGGSAELGFRVGAGLELRPPFMPVGLRFDGAFDRMAIEDFDANWSIWSITANAVLAPAISPVYFIGGLGFYGVDITGEGIDADGETKLGFNLGAGLQLPLTGFSTFLEARYNRVNLDNDATVQYIPIVFGIRF